ncbi:hypothetical protein PMZ80_008913 [Knufia obscura]|uniref:Uncharacterized protein n=2 Tax=Knufia TaxID=430999 RepID=A0AAN8EGM3_9EURO|nr:hypothetical protein PMZ80_008913 [Knufia obscura]KAK5955128.1 hypothetical protein OHC33_003807 [Knufia fluminis]
MPSTARDRGDRSDRNDSKVYWQHKLGLSNEDYKKRRDAILGRLREKWEDRTQLLRCDFHRKKELSDWLRPVVASFDDNRTILVPGRRLSTDAEGLLALYTGWALFANTQDKTVSQGFPSQTRSRKRARTAQSDVESEDEAPPPISSRTRPKRPRLATNLEPELPRKNIEEKTATASRRLSRHAISPTGPTTSPVTVEDHDELPLPITIPSSPLRTTFTQSAPEPSQIPPHTSQPTTTTISSNQTLDWDDIEVKIDANILNAGEIWMTMFDLKPSKHTPSNWHEFKLETLHQQFEAEIGMIFDSDKYEFVYQGMEAFTFSNPGAYKVMLKRFAKSVAVGTGANLLQLRVQARRSDAANINATGHVTASTRISLPHPDRSQRTRRSKSRFTGTESDYSSASETDSSYHPQYTTPTVRTHNPTQTRMPTAQKRRTAGATKSTRGAPRSAKAEQARRRLEQKRRELRELEAEAEAAAFT